MIKYTEKQKLDAVVAYEKGMAGLKATAEAHGVGVDSLRKWVELFRARGLSGIQRKRRSSFDAEFKLVVIRRMEDEGLSSRQTAALLNLRRFDQVEPPRLPRRPVGLSQAGIATCSARSR